MKRKKHERGQVKLLGYDVKPASASAGREASRPAPPQVVGKREPVKYRYDAIHPDFLKALAEIGSYADEKYGSWANYTVGRLTGDKDPINHIYEHARAYQMNEPYDHFEGDARRHLAAIAYNAMMKWYDHTKYGPSRHALDSGTRAIALGARVPQNLPHWPPLGDEEASRDWAIGGPLPGREPGRPAMPGNECLDRSPWGTACTRRKRHRGNHSRGRQREGDQARHEWPDDYTGRSKLEPKQAKKP